MSANIKHGIEIRGSEMFATRTFNAPRELVWEAMTKPEHLKNWYGPRSTTLSHCEVDFRVGGGYRYVVRGANGQEFGFHGEYKEIVPLERVVNTWIFELMPDNGTLETATLSEANGQTTLSLHSEFYAVENIMGWEASGGRDGMAETLERLAEVVESLKANSIASAA